MNFKKQNITIPLAIICGIFLGWLGFYTSTDKVLPLLENRKLVLEVIDGDTFKIDNDQRVRILGINSPERGECYYNEAKEELKKLIEGKIVKLEKDIENVDKYGRLLRYVILEKEGENNLLINDYLVREGFAFDYHKSPNNKYHDLLVTARESAKKENKGLWQNCNYREAEENLRSQDEKPNNPDCVIKGNISEKGYGKTYLIPGCDNYNNVKIDTSRGEEFFCTETEAEKAGFRKATNCP